MSPKHLFKSTLLAAAVAVSAPLAHADKATYEHSNGSKTVFEYEGGNVRMTTGDDDSYTLLKDGEAFSVYRNGDEWTVMPLGEMMGMMGKAVESQGLWNLDNYEWEKTGRRETVAGIRGEVFRFEYDGDESEAVMTRDKDVAAATVAMMSIFTAMVDKEVSDTPWGSEMKGWGTLRSETNGESTTLVSIDTSRSSAERFELPAEPMELGLGKLFGSTPKQETKKPDSTETAEEVADKADAYEDAVESVTDLGESVGKAFNKLFGKD